LCGYYFPAGWKSGKSTDKNSNHYPNCDSYLYQCAAIESSNTGRFSICYTNCDCDRNMDTYSDVYGIRYQNQNDHTDSNHYSDGSTPNRDSDTAYGNGDFTTTDFRSNDYEYTLE
jgi:hypothetical protein